MKTRLTKIQLHTLYWLMTGCGTEPACHSKTIGVLQLKGFIKYNFNDEVWFVTEKGKKAYGEDPAND